MEAGFFVVLGIVLTLFFLIVVPLLIIKAIFGRKDSGGGARPEGKVRNFLGGFPTSFYTMDRKVSSFKIDPSLYDFSMPKVALPKLDKLKEPLHLDTELAEKLYIGRRLVDSSKGLPSNTLDLEKARDLFLPRIGDLLDTVHPEGDEEEEIS